MSGIPYPSDVELDADARATLEALPPLNIVRMFAGAPATLGPLTDLGQAILLHSQLDPRLREIAILAVARESGSNYERVQHEAICRAIGMTDADIEAASAGKLAELEEDAALVARFAASVARDVKADDELTAAILGLLGRRKATELVVCCAYYCAIARIIETCGVELEEKPASEDIDPEGWK
ncbi:MAG: carboxymuconolactone decarboxylase family protein [Actinomycetota bacterium]|nr:carboxymuconolactone decarboxylase family protein [Actinomycetota bacterium]